MLLVGDLWAGTWKKKGHEVYGEHAVNKGTRSGIPKVTGNVRNRVEIGFEGYGRWEVWTALSPPCMWI